MAHVCHHVQFVAKGKYNVRASLAAVGIGFWLTMAGGVSAGPGGSERIIGGDIADPADWPYAVALLTPPDIDNPEGRQFCGGTVISSDAVLTAAHCVVDRHPSDIRVITGRPDLTDTGEGQELSVDTIAVHRRYLRKNRRDVAVIRLASPTSATPVVLATEAEDEAATERRDELRVAGWGATKRNGANSSPVLRDVATFVTKERNCLRAFPFFKAKEEICTHGAEMDKHRTSACYGDSGGPLVAGTLAGPRLVGAVSYGGRRCGVRDPTVYARVAKNLGFIQKKAGLGP